MWIKEIKYGTIDGGSNAGIMAFQIEVGSETPLEGEIAEAIMKIRNFKSGPFKVVLLKGEFPKENDVNVMTLLTPLKNYGYRTMVEVDGKTYRQWYALPAKSKGGSVGPLVDWLVVHINDEPWPAFNCSEIRYHLYRNSSMSPVLPEELGQIQLRVQPEDATPAQVFKFVVSAKENWVLHLEAKKNISTEVWVPEETDDE